MAGTKAFTVYGEITLKGARDVKKELSEATTAGQKFNAAMSSPAVKAAALAATTAVIAFGAASVRAYIVAETSAVRLEAAVNATGQSYDDLAATLDGDIAAAVRRSAYDDEALSDALSTLVQTTGSASDAQEDLGLVMDLARGKNISLATSATIVGKVAAGNTGILARYGIVLDEGATATEALALMQQRFAGQAAAYGDTMEGSIERVNIAWENAQESFGEGLIGDSAAEVQQLADVIDNLAPMLKGVGDAVNEVVVGVSTFGSNAGATLARLSMDSDEYGAKVYDAWYESADRATVSASQFLREVQDGTRTLDGHREKVALLAGATGDYGDEASDAATETDNLTRAMDGAMVASDSLAGKQRTLTELDLANRTAQLDRTAAYERLAEVMADGESSADDIARAQIGVEQAEIRAADAAADMAAGIDTLGNPVDVSQAIASVEAVEAAMRAAMTTANNTRAAMQRALSLKYGGGTDPGTQTGGAFHGGGAVTTSGMYSLQKGEMVLRESQVERIVERGGTVSQSAQIVVIADPRYTDMAKLEADVRRVNDGDVSAGAMLGLMGMTA
jgi:hypothetical protein